MINDFTITLNLFEMQFMTVNLELNHGLGKDI